MPRSSSKHIRGTIAAAALLASAAAVPGRTSAAACCASATSFGIGRLAVWESWAAGLQLGYARSLGQFDSEGSLRPNGFSGGLTTAQGWAIVRLHDRVQMQGWIPVAIEDRHLGSVSQIAGGLGDMGAAVRLEILKIGEYEWLPAFAVTASALAPTGKRTEETSLPLLAGTTGRGAWGGSLAIEAERARIPWFVKLDAGITGYLAFSRSDTGVRQQYGPMLRAMLSVGREVFRDKLVAAVAVTGEWEAPGTLDGETVSASRAYQYTLAGSLAWTVAPRWTLVGNVANNVWPDGAGMNRDARLGFTLGVRYGHF